jgi:acyl dehydratase
MSHAAKAYEYFRTTPGQEQGAGEWFEISQERINDFADCTIDHQFIHIDPTRAKAETPFGGTIAHGFLTLSMITHLCGSIPPDPKTPSLDGIVMGINYGFDRVRFLNPVNAGKKVRASATIKSADLKGSAIDQVRTITVEIEGVDKPALVADWITRLVFAD